MTNEKLFEYIGLNRAQIIAAVAGTSQRKLAIGSKSRPDCLVCGLRINETNCRPFRQPVAEKQSKAVGLKFSRNSLLVLCGIAQRAGFLIDRLSAGLRLAAMAALKGLSRGGKPAARGSIHSAWTGHANSVWNRMSPSQRRTAEHRNQSAYQASKSRNATAKHEIGRVLKAKYAGSSSRSEAARKAWVTRKGH